MLDLVLVKQQPQTSNSLLQRARLQWGFWYLGILAAAVLVGLLLYRGTPNFSSIAWAVLLLNIVLVVYRPRFGLYLIAFWALAGDHALMTWYPAIKNFSSRETLLFLHDEIIFSPLELLLVVTTLSWLIRETMQRRLRLYLGSLFLPIMLFAAFITFGLLYGLGRGGSVNIALWETRAMYYMVLMAILIGNLFKKKEHIKNLIGVIVAALVVKSLYGTYFLIFVLRGDLGNIASLTDHQAGIHLATMIVLLAAAWLYRVNWQKQLLLLATMPPILLTFLAAQRRSAFVALLIALALLTFIMYRERRKAFWLIVPPAAVLGLAYIGAFWNSTGAVAGPAQAVKSVIAESQADTHDQQSNQYRVIENYNSTFTIRQEPLTGVGFGNKFYIIIPLPDISGFIWWEYMPHNSVIYIWIKSGVGGFIALLLFIGLSIVQGMRAAVRITDPYLKAIAQTAALYVVIHFIYAYVDISWDSQNMVMLASMIGILNCIEPIVAADVSPIKRRWPWQPQPQQPTPLLPLPTP